MPRGGQLLIVANRLPVHRVARGGRTSWEAGPGGLVSALTPILQGRHGEWIGWTGKSGSAPRAFTHEGIALRPVALSRGEVESYYEGFSNRTLWPLYHDVVRRPEFHRTWWKPYVEVNRRFAGVAARLAGEGATVWVHDYHLQLVPGFLRESRPDLRIGFFLHIPFPQDEVFAQLPWRREVVEGVLGADVVGFQTEEDARSFRAAARRFTDATIRGKALESDGRSVCVGAFPISIDVEQHERLARSPEVRRRAQVIRRRLGVKRKMLLGVDRLDYTKGIDLRLRAFEELLSSGRLSIRDVVFVQVAVPSRERIPDYQETREHIERLVGGINGRFAQVGFPAVQYLRRSVPPRELAALYCAADVMVVTPLRDGMNLVAKEFVTSRAEETGALVLSEFAGAAGQLPQALLVNPHDLDGIERAIVQALTMPRDEAARRMRSMRSAVRRDDVHQWAERFLGALVG